MFNNGVYRGILCPESEEATCIRPHCPFSDQKAPNHQRHPLTDDSPWLDRGSTLWKLTQFDFLPALGTKCQIHSNNSGPTMTIKNPSQPVNTFDYGEAVVTTPHMPFFPKAPSRNPPQYTQDLPIYTPSASTSYMAAPIKEEPGEEDVVFVELVKKDKPDEMDALIAQEEKAMRELKEKQRKFEKLQALKKKRQRMEEKFNNMLNQKDSDERSKRIKKKPALDDNADFSEDESDDMSPVLKKPKEKVKSLPPRDSYVPTPLVELERMHNRQSSSTIQKPEKKLHKTSVVEKEKHLSTEEFLQDLFGSDEKVIKKSEPIPKVSKTPKAPVSEPESSGKLTKDQISTAKSLSNQQVSRPIRPIDTTKKVLRPSAQIIDRYEKMVKKAANPKASKIREKGTARLAHQPSTSMATRLLEPGLKTTVPSKTRLVTVDKIFNEMKKKGIPNADMVTAMEEELKLVRSVSSLTGYNNKAVALLLKIRGNDSSTTNRKSVSHMANLIGPKANEISLGSRKSIDRPEPQKMTKDDFYKHMKKYLLTPEELAKNNYPCWKDETKTEALITASHWDTAPGREGRDKRFVSDSELERHCSRCGKRYFLHKQGELQKADCYYHPYRMRKKRENKALVSRYPCCDGTESALGCSFAQGHVSETSRISELFRFREFPKATGPGDPRSRQVYALDCEMVYTVWGPALARVSVVDRFDMLVLDVKVLPEHTLIDANTKFSGLTIEELEREGCSWDSAMKQLDQLINEKTILIGHSLESDLKAMRIIHKRVIDTALVFPHKLPDYKWSLKDLAAEKLQKIIQEDVTGHDSKEDAGTCMLLMIHKLGKGE